MAYSGAYHPKNDGAEEERRDKEEHGAGERENAPVGAPGRRERRAGFDLGSLFQKTEVAGMETDDLLMALVLYLMYRESGDTDLLIMLGVMLLT